MCYAKPGPRCSAHAKAYLDKAVREFGADPSAENRSAMIEALEEYKTSPAGIKKLREQGKEDEADLYKKRRKDRIDAYNINMNASDYTPKDIEDASDVRELVVTALRRTIRRGGKPDIDLCRTIIESCWDNARLETYGQRRYLAGAKVSPAAWELIKSGQSKGELKGEHVYPAKVMVNDWFTILQDTNDLPVQVVLDDLLSAPFAIITKEEDDQLGDKEGKVKDCMPEGWTSDHEHGKWARYAHRSLEYKGYKTISEWRAGEECLDG